MSCKPKRTSRDSDYFIDSEVQCEQCYNVDNVDDGTSSCVLEG